MNQELPKYTGKIHPPVGGEYIESLNRKLYPYYPDDELVEAVNLAISLNRPLLLEGEPGCGKSDLARAVFYEFSKKAEEEKNRAKITWNFRLWNIQSTSKAEDGFYNYDYIGRLRDAQLAQANIQYTDYDPKKPSDYIEWEALGNAFRDGKKGQEDQRSIVLIDEIDKANTDFPNDLLLALEDKRIKVKEIKGTESIDNEGWLIAEKDAFPIIFITSNQAKELPNEFLRRCLYHYIEFPAESELTKIIKGRFRNPPSEIVNAAIQRFLKLRSEKDDEEEKNISTSEFIDWFTILNDYPPEEVRKKLEQEKLPYKSTMLKTRQNDE